MALYIDSADINDVRCALGLGFIAGVTTNPALIAKTGRPGLDVLKEILALSNGPVFYQVTAETLEGRADQARVISALAPRRIHVKIPATTENIGLAARLTQDGMMCAVTAVSDPAQAYLAALAGATYVAPYVNRLSRQLGDGIAVLRRCVQAVQGTPTRVLAASLKSVDEVMQAVDAGAHDITIPLDLILKMGDHELSQKAIEEFAAATRSAGFDQS
jgi:transaldolase